MEEIKSQNYIEGVNTNNKMIVMLKNGLPSLLIAGLLGITGYYIQIMTGSSLADPLFIALLLGILTRAVFGQSEILRHGSNLALVLLIPAGTILYGAVNLNFVKFAALDIRVVFLMIVVVLAYFGVIVALGKWLKQREKTTYLLATGSAICGASAIAIMSPAVEAEPDDISVSLISVFIAGIFGLFILFPFLASLFGVTDKVYAVLSGTTLQFTGFVKAAVGELPKEISSLAISVKAARYMVLFLAIPLFSSIIRKKFFIPWFLWAFLAAGLVFSFFPEISTPLIPIIKPVLDILWATAMAAIGLNADIKMLLSDNGLKALLMAFGGFFAAILVSLLGVSMFF